MNRYTRLFENLSSLPKRNLRICEAKMKFPGCACNGCAGMVGNKWVTKQELEMYLSGELKTYLNKD